MAFAFGLGAFAVSAVIVAVVVVFLWQLARGALGDDAHTLRILHRMAWAATCVLTATAVAATIVTLTSPAVTLIVPMQSVWPLSLPDVEVDAGTATVEYADTATAPLTLSGLSLPVRLLWSAGQALGILLPAAIALLVARGAALLRDGAPFSPVLTRTTGVAALIVFVAGSAAPVLSGIAGSMASFEALRIRSASWTGYPDDWSPQEALPQPSVFVPFEFWPVGVAAALLIVTAILRYGERLQKDTEGLV